MVVRKIMEKKRVLWKKIIDWGLGQEQGGGQESPLQ